MEKCVIPCMFVSIVETLHHMAVANLQSILKSVYHRMAFKFKHFNSFFHQLFPFVEKMMLFMFVKSGTRHIISHINIAMVDVAKFKNHIKNIDL